MTENQIMAILKTGFLLQYFTKEAIQSWARYKLEHQDAGSAIFDLTFSHPKQGEIIIILNKISGPGHDKVIKEYFFGFYRKTFLSNQFPARVIEKEIIRFIEMDMVELSEEEAVFFVQLDADYSLWKDGISFESDIQHLSFLDRYTKFEEIQSALSAESIPEPILPN